MGRRGCSLARLAATLASQPLFAVQESDQRVSPARRSISWIVVADASGGIVDQAEGLDGLVGTECCLQLGESVTVCTRTNIAVLQHLPATFGSSIRIVGKELTFDVALELPGRKTVRRGQYPALECCDRLGVDPGESVDNLAHTRIVQLAGGECGLGERKELT